MNAPLPTTRFVASASGPQLECENVVWRGILPGCDD